MTEEELLYGAYVDAINFIGILLSSQKDRTIEVPKAVFEEFDRNMWNLVADKDSERNVIIYKLELKQDQNRVLH